MSSFTGRVHAGVFSFQAQVQAASHTAYALCTCLPWGEAQCHRCHLQLHSDPKHHPAVEPKNEKALQPVKGPCCRLVTHLPNGTLIVMMTNLERIAFASPAVFDSPVGSLANWLD